MIRKKTLHKINVVRENKSLNVKLNERKFKRVLNFFQIIMITIFFFSVFTWSRKIFRDRLKRFVVQKGNISRTWCAEGYIVRNETLISSGEYDFVYLIDFKNDAIPVAKEEALALILKSKTDKKIKNELLEIKQKEKECIVAEKLKESRNILREVRNGVVKSVRENDFKTAATLVSLANLNLNFDPKEELNRLRIKEKELISLMHKSIIFSPMSGLFFNYDDRFGIDFFDFENIDENTISKLELQIKEKEKDHNLNHIGIICDNLEWYIVLKTSADNKIFKTEDMLDVSFESSSDKIIRMKIAHLKKIENDYLLVLSASECFELILGTSKAPIKISKVVASGYKIPVESLKNIDGTVGVFVEKNGCKIFKKVEVMEKDNKYAIISDDPASYINVYDVLLY